MTRRPRELTDEQLLKSAWQAVRSHQNPRRTRRQAGRLPEKSDTTIVDRADPCPVCHQPIHAGHPISTHLTADGPVVVHHWCATTRNLDRL